MKPEKRTNSVDLSSADKVRMEKLSEEVAGRLEEMSLIIARSLGKSSRDRAAIVFNHRLTSTEPVQVDRSYYFEGITMTIYGDGSCACHDHDAQECFAC